MAEVDPNRMEDEQIQTEGQAPDTTAEPEEKEPFTPASFEKRTAAWMGIAYALMFLFIITFSMFHPDRTLAGTFPLFLVPVAVAAIVIAIYRQCKGTAPGGLPTTIVVVILCAAAAGLGLWLGLPVLIMALVG